ncbi:MAG: GNAT family N-acetyltransferase [Eubacteriales bacterium]|nr:GNAT family N-acetyltransferase [Eubacteriales bacterium]
MTQARGLPQCLERLIGPEKAAAITTRRLMLRRPRMADAADFFAFARDGEVARYVMWDTHTHIRDSRRALRGILARTRAQGAETFAICPRDTGRLIGTIGPVWLDWDNRACEVGFSLARPYWGQGLLTEALGAFLGYAFQGLGLNRVEGQYDLRNPASGRVMEKAGMAREGELRQRLHYKGQYADVGLYAITHDAWRHQGSKP